MSYMGSDPSSYKIYKYYTGGLDGLTVDTTKLADYNKLYAWMHRISNAKIAGLTDDAWLDYESCDGPACLLQPPPPPPQLPPPLPPPTLLQPSKNLLNASKLKMHLLKKKMHLLKCHSNLHVELLALMMKEQPVAFLLTVFL